MRRPSSSPPRRRSRSRGPSLDLPIRRRSTADAEPGDLVRVDERARPAARLGALEQRVADRAAHDVAIGGSAPSTTSARGSASALERARSRSATTLGDRRDGVPARPRRSRSACRRSIVDRYGDEHGTYLVVQTLSQGMDRRLPLIVELLRRPARAARASWRATIRRCAGSRGSTSASTSLCGDVPDAIEVREGDVRYRRRPAARTEDRAVSRSAREPRRGGALRARPRARRFTYNGGFALPLARARGRGPRARLVGPGGRARRARTRSRNGLANVEVREANVFDELRELEIARRAVRHDRARSAGVREEQGRRRARGGRLQGDQPARAEAARARRAPLTCSCSYNVDDDAVSRHRRSRRARRAGAVALVEKRLQARDHPVLLGVSRRRTTSSAWCCGSSHDSPRQA